MTEDDEIVEAMARAAWVDYCTPSYNTPDDRPTDEEPTHRERAEQEWREWPQGCTHIGADGFRSCARAALRAYRERMELL